LRVNGGLTLVTGGLSLQEQSLATENILLNSKSSTHSLLAGTADSISYSGAMINLFSSSNTDFSYFRANQKNTSSSSSFNKIVYEIHGDGSLTTTGGISVSGRKGLNVNTQSSLIGGLSVGRIIISAGVIIDLSHIRNTYITILDDHLRMKNELILGNRSSGAIEGEVRIISNMDEQTTHGDLTIPSLTTVFLIFDGNKWLDMHALHVTMTVIIFLTSIQVFECVGLFHLGFQRCKNFRS
jgi:hypothetical protein